MPSLDSVCDPLLAEHTPSAIAERLARHPSASYLRDIVYGAIDGVVTTFAVIGVGLAWKRWLSAGAQRYWPTS